MSPKIDIDLEWRGDFGFSASGDLAIVASGQLTHQRVLRRLLTTPGDYLWALSYGAGLGQLVGKPIDSRAVEAMIRLQLKHEESVASTPEPQVLPVSNLSVTNNDYVIRITYVEDQSATEKHLTMDLAR